MKQALLTTAVVLTALCSGCDDDSPSGPSEGAIVTFAVVNETFHVWLTSAEQIDAASAAQAGGRARIPIGRIVSGTQVNIGWSWHLEDVVFAEATIELCDGLPSHVEQQGTSFGGGRYCPWSARVVAIDKRRRVTMGPLPGADAFAFQDRVETALGGLAGVRTMSARRRCRSRLRTRAMRAEDRSPHHCCGRLDREGEC